LKVSIFLYTLQSWSFGARKLPKYLLEDREAMRQIKKLKSAMLKQSYAKLYSKLNDIDSKAFKNAMHSALQERARYYANRIAQTEAARSRNLSRAKEYFDDDEIKLVKFTMSSAHSIMDICNYYAALDVGYGAGIVPKEQMRVLGLHPHCSCRYIPEYKNIKRKTIKNPEKHTMDKFSDREKRQILGSENKLQDYRDGADVEGIFNRVRPKYPIKKYDDVLGYNKDMQRFTKEILTKDEITSIKAWTDDSSSIKQYMWGLTDNSVAKKHAENMFSLFDKYKPNVKSGTVLYRGMSFTKEMFEIFNYHKITKGDLHTPDDMAIVSFSTDRKKAFEYATMSNQNNYKVAYILQNETKALDISKISTKPSEEENIITKATNYKVIYVREFKRGDELWKIIKIKEV